MYYFLDVNECSDDADNDCDVNANCFNNNGSYECACKDGYIGQGFEDTCTGQYMFPKCSIPSYCYCPLCSLPLTLVYNISLHTYVPVFTDVDECLSPELNNCSRFATCLNTNGSYNCVCTHGYLGNGYHCCEFTSVQPYQLSIIVCV